MMPDMGIPFLRNMRDETPRTLGAGDGTSFVISVLALALAGCARGVPAARSPRMQLDRPAIAGLTEAPHVSRRDRVLGALAAAEPELDRSIARADLCGLVIGLVLDGELVWHRSAGVADMTTGSSIDLDTMFRIGSVTKTVTGLALLRLRDAGKVALDDPLTRYLPEAAHVRYPTADSAPMTVRELVAHAAGLTRLGGPVPLMKPDGQGASEPDVLASLGTMTLAEAPGLGGSDSYSNLGAALAGAVVSRAAGQSYSDYVGQRILLPLGMTRSAYSIEQRSNVASGHVRRDGNWARTHPVDMGAFDAAGGLYSTLSDLARYVTFQISAWPPRDDAEQGPVRRSTVRESQLISGFQRPSASAVGVFWRLRNELGVDDWVDHNGVLVEGFVSEVAFVPSRGVGVIALADSIDARQSAPVEQLVRAVLGDVLPAASPALAETARFAISELVGLGFRWDEQRAEILFSSEFRAHVSLAKVRSLLSAVVGTGACSIQGVSGSKERRDWTVRLRCTEIAYDLHVRLGSDETDSAGTAGDAVPGDTTARPVVRFLTIKPAQDP
jgi:CubicO group peptidase (beta-lactamase class C family)